MKVTIARVLGLSADYRTQRWKVICPNCEKEFTPQTTLLAQQEIECPKCGLYSLADYNAEPPTVRLLNNQKERKYGKNDRNYLQMRMRKEKNG